MNDDRAWGQAEEATRKVHDLERRVDDLRAASRSAIDELRRWQYADDPGDVRHSIEMAIRTLERA